MVSPREERLHIKIRRGNATWSQFFTIIFSGNRQQTNFIKVTIQILGNIFSSQFEKKNRRIFQLPE